MRRLLMLAAILILFVPISTAFAGRIFGDIKMDGKPLPEGVRVQITLPVPGEGAKTEGAKTEGAKGEGAKAEASKAEAGKPEASKAEAGKPEAGKVASAKPKGAPAVADTTTTDKFGSYKLTVKEEGKCTLTLVYEKQPVSIEIFSYKEATRYDLILEKKDGKLSLRRK